MLGAKGVRMHGCTVTRSAIERVRRTSTIAAIAVGAIILLAAWGFLVVRHHYHYRPRGSEHLEGVTDHDHHLVDADHVEHCDRRGFGPLPIDRVHRRLRVLLAHPEHQL